MFFDPRETKADHLEEVEQKSWATEQTLSFGEFLADAGLGDLTAYYAISLYKKAMPLFNAIDLRSETFAQIPVRLKKKNSEGQDETIISHPVIDLLEKPNADLSMMEFMGQISSYLDIAGEVFIAATGNVDRPPKEVAVVAPQLVMMSGEALGFLNVPKTMTVNLSQGGSVVFTAEEKNNGRGLRYVSADRLKELWHVRLFNPNRQANNYRGMSKAQPLWLELQQYIEGNINNLSQLKRGTRMSMAWVNTRGVALTDKQWNRMQEEAQKYSGSANAGGTPVLDGMDVKAIQQTNRDMEYGQLQEANLSRVSTVYRVPLALLLPQSMTLDNLKTAMIQLYDFGTLPQATRIYSELARFLLPRYPDTEGMFLDYNENDIPALRERMLTSTKLLKDIDVNTIDELRQEIGYNDLDEGGGDVFRPAGYVPVGQEFEDDDEIIVDDVTDDE